MNALSALLPCATVIITILWLRQSGVLAATASATVACILWASSVFAPPEPNHLENALVDSVILQILVAAIIFPGLIFVEISRRVGTTEAVGKIINDLRLNPALAAIMIAAGFGVLIESLTGFGVSLLLTVPLLTVRFKKSQAIGLALVGMCLMPWGALGVAAHLGAELAETPLLQLSYMIWKVSGPIALILPVFCLIFIPNRSFTDLSFALCAGLLLSGGIGLGTYLVGIEIAGALGGILVILLIAQSASSPPRLMRIFTKRKLAPYYFLICAVLMQKFLVICTTTFDITPAISSSRVTFAVFTSPGISLLIASLITALAFKTVQQEMTAEPQLASFVWQRAWRPLTAIFLFTFGARLLVEIGATQALADFISATGAQASLITVTMLGALSGFVTGSGIAGNALFMPSAAATGMNLDSTALFAAMQHGAAGHTAMASLPVGAILLAVLPNRFPEDERHVMRTGLCLSIIMICLLIFSGLLLLHNPN